MFPEQLSMQLVRLIADEIDTARIGAAIEIGVGTNNFYSLIYKALGFNTIAVDPIAYAPFLKMAIRDGIVFDESCIYKENGEQVIYISPHADLNSLHNNWWGVSGKKSKIVKSQDLQTFIKKHEIHKISFLKVDTEGSEYDILQQFYSLNRNLLPDVIEFEYGGGGVRNEGKGGWGDAFFKKSLDTIDLLKSLNYKEAIIFDSIDLEPTFFDFDSNANFDSLFKPSFEYGNLIAFKQRIKDKRFIKEQILNTQNALLGNYISDLKEENKRLYFELIKKNYAKRILNKIRRPTRNK